MTLYWIFVERCLPTNHTENTQSVFFLCISFFYFLDKVHHQFFPNECFQFPNISPSFSFCIIVGGEYSLGFSLLYSPCILAAALV